MVGLNILLNPPSSSDTKGTSYYSLLSMHQAPGLGLPKDHLPKTLQQPSGISSVLAVPILWVRNLSSWHRVMQSKVEPKYVLPQRPSLCPQQVITP